MKSARDMTQTLLGHWYGRYGVAPCPVCQPEARPEQNALTLADGTIGLLLHCKKAGCSFRDLAAALGISHGHCAAPDPAAFAACEADRLAWTENRARQAQALWFEASLIGGTIAETYLRERGIICALPDTLRYHPEAWHLSRRRLPALIARVDGADGFAVHRTYLRQDGKGKAVVEPKKVMLGAVKGGAVRLTGARGPLVVAEGIETALSLASGILRGPAIIWAALSTSGIPGLRLLNIPGCLIVATDGDDAGKSAGQALADRAANLGWDATLFSAPEGYDWNDVLSLKSARHDIT